MRGPLAVLGTIAIAAAGCGGGGDDPTTAKTSAFADFRSRPDLKPPTVAIEQRTDDVSPGYVFLGPKKKVRQQGPLIVDDEGHVVWFRPLRAGATDFRVQRYRGKPVLTWWQGVSERGIGRGKFVIVDDAYRQVAVVRAGNGQAGDEHEFLLTARGTALIPAYRAVPGDLSSVGGPKRGKVMDSVLQEIDVATGRVVFEWHSVGHVALGESYTKPRKVNGRFAPFDYFHINSIEVEPNGNLLVSARNTSALYEIDRRTGKVLWRLGGKRSDFQMGPGTRFHWQHDARRHPDGTISLFDDGAAPKVADYSRGLILRQHMAAKKVTLAHAYVSPEKLLAEHQGGMQVLPNGHVFVGWGSEPYFTEFARDGEVVLHATFGKGRDSYRAYRFPWVGRPVDRPALAVAGGKAYVSWNGATDVARWRILGGEDGKALEEVADAEKTDFETAVELPDDLKSVAAQALDRDGRLLGTSRTAAVGEY